jgi:hypothetical protein
MSKHEDSIVEGACGMLLPGEEIIAALVVSPRGTSTAAAPGLAAGEIGRRWSNKNKAAAEDIGLIVKRNSGLALTNRRLIALDLAISLTGGVKEVRSMLSETSVDQIDGVTSNWNVLTITAGAEALSSNSSASPRPPRRSPARSLRCERLCELERPRQPRLSGDMTASGPPERIRRATEGRCRRSGR